MQLGIRKVTLGLVVGSLHDQVRGFASAGFARPCVLRFGFGSALALGLRFRLGLCLQPPHGPLNLGQALLTAG